MNSGIIDLIIRIKNGYLAKRDVISSPHSKLKEQVLKKLKSLGFILDYSIETEGPKKEISITLKYKHGAPVFTDVTIRSKPGQRWYITVNSIKPVMSGTGYMIISTSKGLMTNVEARKSKLGGELLFEIW